MKIAVIGAGYPGRIIASELATDMRAEVFLIGKRDQVGVLSGLGPRHLWRDDFNEHLGDLYKVLVRTMTEPLDAFRASRNGFRIGYTTRDLEVLSNKTGKQYDKRHRPCRGVVEYWAIADGFAAIDRELDLNHVAQMEAMVSGVEPGKDRRWCVRLEGIASMDFDVVVTTIHPTVFARLCPTLHSAPPPGRPMYFYEVSDRVSETLGLDDSDMIVYNAAPEDPWYRASRTARRWVIESLVPIESLIDTGVQHFKPIASMRQPCSSYWDAIYPAGIYPFGRDAEWDGELMVNDCYAAKEATANLILNTAYNL